MLTVIRCIDLDRSHLAPPTLEEETRLRRTFEATYAPEGSAELWAVQGWAFAVCGCPLTAAAGALALARWWMTPLERRPMLPTASLRIGGGA